jgi:anti-sigma B factor antagonist
VTEIVPVVVELPAEIDVTNSERVFATLIDALAPGVTAVIADMTSTVFCDSSGVRALFHANLEAMSRTVPLRLAISPDSAVWRVLRLTGANQVIPIYPSVPEAMTADPG